MLRLPTKDELETARSAQDFLPWVEGEIRRLGSSKAGRTALRLGKGLAKELAEEAFAVGIFAAKHFDKSAHVTIQCLVGNQPYDAIVTGSSPIQYIEVTQAHEGRNAHLRMLHLEKHGRVSPIGEVTEHDREIFVESCALSHDEILAKELDKILAAAKRKSIKTYPANTVLLIPFDDYIAVGHEDDEAKLDTFVRQRVIPEVDHFHWVAVIGWSKKTFLIYDTHTPS